jgi:3-oxoacyl-[acyl-carrier protein] reductase
MADERVIILTGAASGIGRAAAEALAQQSRVLALVDVNPQGLEEAVAMCRQNSPRTMGFTCDTTDEAAVKRTYQEIHKEFGTPSTLINCAGIGRFAPFLELTPADWMRMFTVNVMGAVLFTQTVLPAMIAAREGHIINVGSRMAIDPHPGTTAYAASKAALNGFSKALAMDVKAQGIQVTYLAPGGTVTNIATPKHEGYLEPKAIADAIVYLCGNAGNVWVRDLVVLPLGF